MVPGPRVYKDAQGVLMGSRSPGMASLWPAWDPRYGPPKGSKKGVQKGVNLRGPILG